MAPLAQALALLAIVVDSVAIKVVPLDMAKESFDDQYLNCGDYMTKKLPELQRSDFLNNSEFADVWTEATDEWKKLETVPSPLTADQAIALMAYTMITPINFQFNEAVRDGGNSSRKYQEEFHFKSLHFLLTRALQTLRRPNDCRDVFTGVSRYHFQVKEGDQIRFGRFMPTVLNETLAWDFKDDTMFKVHTCHGADIQKFSMDLMVEVVLIPPFETFRVTGVREEGNTTHIELRSTGTFSNYNCEWLKGGSLPRTSPHIWGLVVFAMAMAMVSGTL